MARPGLEPGTPRFSVVRANLSNEPESPGKQRVLTVGLAAAKARRFHSFPPDSGDGRRLISHWCAGSVDLRLTPMSAVLALVSQRGISSAPRRSAGASLLRADSGFWNKKVIARLREQGCRYSVGVTMHQIVTARVALIPEDAWEPVDDYPDTGVCELAETTLGEDRLILATLREERPVRTAMNSASGSSGSSMRAIISSHFGRFSKGATRSSSNDADFLAQRTPGGWPTLEHAYAMTAPAAKGLTCRLVLARDDTYREWAITTMSRATHANRLCAIAGHGHGRDEFAPVEPPATATSSSPPR
jgi:hypothetical protein